MKNAVIHLRLGQVTGGQQDGDWVSECGHYASSEASTADRALVTCRSCKRTRAYRHPRYT